MRYEAPVSRMGRVAKVEFEWHGQTIKAGDRVFLSLASANRDEERFERGNEYIADRSPNPHLTFGHGPHQCMGAPIARAELQTMLRQIIEKTSNFELAAEPVSNGRPLRTGWSHVRVRFEK